MHENIICTLCVNYVLFVIDHNKYAQDACNLHIAWTITYNTTLLSGQGYKISTY